MAHPHQMTEADVIEELMDDPWIRSYPRYVVYEAELRGLGINTELGLEFYASRVRPSEVRDLLGIYAQGGEKKIINNN